MPTRYLGLFCPDKDFNVVETYTVAHVHARALVDWVGDRPGSMSLWAVRQGICVPTGRHCSFKLSGW